MTIDCSAGPPRSALERYERLVSLSDSDGIQPSWPALASDLRAEATQYTCGQRDERLARALDCDARARRSRSLRDTEPLPACWFQEPSVIGSLQPPAPSPASVAESRTTTDEMEVTS